MIGKTLVLSRALLLSFVRDKASVFFSVVFPFLFLVLFGGVFDFGGSRTELVAVGDVPVLDGPVVERYADVLDVTRSDDRADALQQVADGDVAAAVEQQGDEVVVHFSRVDAIAAGTTQGLLSAIVGEANQEASGRPPRYALSFEQVEDESLDQIQYVLPGLLGWAVATSGAFAAAMSLVIWRRSKLLRRLRLAPVPVAAVVSARVLVSLGVALVQAAIFIGAGVAVFGLQLTGSWWMAVPVVVAATLAFLSIGMFAGAVARSEEATVALVNLVILPMAFLSGSFIPLDAAPSWIRTVSVVLPLTHANEGMLDTMVRGQAWTAALPQIAILLAFAAAFALLATRCFSWRSESD